MGKSYLLAFISGTNVIKLRISMEVGDCTAWLSAYTYTSSDKHAYTSSDKACYIPLCSEIVLDPNIQSYQFASKLIWLNS